MLLTRRLWDVVFQPAQVDPAELARAIEDEAVRVPLDFRTRLLIRDSVHALIRHWGAARVMAWLGSSNVGETVEAILQEASPQESGFPSLRERIMEPTRRDTVLQLLRELSTNVTTPGRLVIGGSIALLLAGRLSRHTEDIDIVDEVPAELRAQPSLIDQLASRYGLRLTHFQSHFLPEGWEQRIHSLDPMGRLAVFIIDAYDVALSKLFSPRERDRDDLRVLAPQLDRSILTERLASSTRSFLADSTLRSYARENWFILFGENLPA